MYLFILGVILGIGLAFAALSVDKTLQLRRLHKKAAYEQSFNDAVQAAAEALYYGWSSSDLVENAEALSDAGHGPSNW